MVTYHFSKMDRRSVYNVLTSVVIPRPIALVSSLSSQGIVNVAPFSFFMGVSAEPPLVALSISRKRSGFMKDTLKNIVDTKELCIHITDHSQSQKVHDASFEFPSEVSEAEKLHFEMEPSELIKVPKWKAAPIQMECRLFSCFYIDAQGVKQETPSEHWTSALVLASVLVVHVREDLHNKRNEIDAALWSPLARISGPYYASLGDVEKLDFSNEVQG